MGLDFTAIEFWEEQLIENIGSAFSIPIDMVYNRISKDKPYSIFTEYERTAIDSYDAFKKQLRVVVNQSNNLNILENDLKRNFLLMIENYLNWYEQHRDEFAKFGKKCPYYLLWETVICTKTVILEYFPEALPQQKQEAPAAQRKKIPNAVVGVFCKLVSESGLNPQGSKESNEKFCKRICSLYGLEYVVKIRTHLNENQTKELVQKVQELILPLINPHDKEVINNYLGTKSSPPPKLYG